MKNLFVLILFVLLSSCTNHKIVKIEALEGYWEVKYITEKGEQFTPKKTALLYDYYQMNYPKGLLKKVAPNPDGTFSTSEDATLFELEKVEKNYFIHFKSRWDEWSRKILYLDQEQLVLENDNREFYYKRPYQKTSNE